MASSAQSAKNKGGRGNKTTAWLCHACGEMCGEDAISRTQRALPTRRCKSCIASKCKVPTEEEEVILPPNVMKEPPGKQLPGQLDLVLPPLRGSVVDLPVTAGILPLFHSSGRW